MPLEIYRQSGEAYPETPYITIDGRNYADPRLKGDLTRSRGEANNPDIILESDAILRHWLTPLEPILSSEVVSTPLIGGKRQLMRHGLQGEFVKVRWRFPMWIIGVGADEDKMWHTEQGLLELTAANASRNEEALALRVWRGDWLYVDNATPIVRRL